MSKKRTALFVMEHIVKQGLKHKIMLNSRAGYAVHVRIYELGDCWPSTGSYKFAGTNGTKDVKGLIKAINRFANKEEMPTQKELTVDERIDTLENQYEELAHSFNILALKLEELIEE